MTNKSIESSFDERQIVLSAIVFLFIGAFVGVIGLMVNYAIFPSILLQPTCECIQLQDQYDQLRQSFTALGFIYSLIPITVWQIYIRRKI